MTPRSDFKRTARRLVASWSAVVEALENFTSRGASGIVAEVSGTVRGIIGIADSDNLMQVASTHAASLVTSPEIFGATLPPIPSESGSNVNGGSNGSLWSLSSVSLNNCRL